MINLSTEPIRIADLAPSLSILAVAVLVLLPIMVGRRYMSFGSQLLITLLVLLAFSSLAQARMYEFKFKGGYKVMAATYKEAAKLCFTGLTKGKYPGEERGLDIIDVCVNPVTPKGYIW